jgi:hypothetical protein
LLARVFVAAVTPELKVFPKTLPISLLLSGLNIPES